MGIIKASMSALHGVAADQWKEMFAAGEMGSDLLMTRDMKSGNWKIFPIFPQEWKYQVSKETKKQFAILKALMSLDKVNSIVNACDADDCVLALIHSGRLR